MLKTVEHDIVPLAGLVAMGQEQIERRIASDRAWQAKQRKEFALRATSEIASQQNRYLQYLPATTSRVVAAGASLYPCLTVQVARWARAC